MKLAKVQFLVDFRGKLTREHYYVAGTVAEFDCGVASQLVEEERAVFAEEPQEVALAEEVTDPAPEEKQKRVRKAKA